MISETKFPSTFIENEFLRVEYLTSVGPRIIGLYSKQADIELLARTKQSVAYCPRASEYFGNHTRLGGHRYREMLAAGVNVWARATEALYGGASL